MCSIKSGGEDARRVTELASLNRISLSYHELILKGVVYWRTHQNEATLPSNRPLLTGKMRLTT
jgi:hypothetical protein